MSFAKIVAALVERGEEELAAELLKAVAADGIDADYVRVAMEGVSSALEGVSKALLQFERLNMSNEARAYKKMKSQLETDYRDLGRILKKM